MDEKTKKGLRVLGSALSCACWTILFVRSWTRASAHGTYLTKTLWGIAMLASLFSLIFWIRQDE